MFNKKMFERFSIRKLSVGAASVLIGFSFLSMNDINTVHAAEVKTATSKNAAKTSQKEKVQDTDKATTKPKVDPIQKAKQEVEKNTKDVNAKQATFDQKQAAKKQADDAVVSAQDALNKSNPKDAQAAADAAQKKVAQDKKDLATAKNDVNTKASAQKEANKQTEKAQNDKVAADKAQASAQKDYDTKKKASDDAQASIQKQKKAVEDLTKQAAILKEKTKNTIVIPQLDKFKKAFADSHSKTGLTAEDIEYLKSNRYSNNKFISSDADRNITVDPSHLTNDQVKELSLFYSDLINKVRKQLALPQDMVVSKGSVDFAQAIAQKYRDDHWMTNNHDHKGINETADDFGLYSYEGNQRNIEQPYEDAVFHPGYHPTSMTMDQLKHELYDGVKGMILAYNKGFGINNKLEYEMDHTAGVLSIVYTREGKIVATESGSHSLQSIETKARRYYAKEIDNLDDPALAMGYTLDEINSFKNGVSKGNYGGGIGYYRVENVSSTETNYYIKDKKVTKEQLLSSIDSALALRKKINAEIKKLEAEQPKVYVSANNSDSGEYIEHYLNVVDDRINLNSKFSKQEYPSYAEQIAQNDKDLADAKKIYQPLADAAQTKLDAANAATKTLENAKANAQKAQDALNTAKTNSANATTALQNAQKAQKEAEEQLAQDQADSEAKQEALKNIPALIAKNKKALAEAKDTQAKANKEFEEAEKQLNAAKDKLAKAQAKYDALTYVPVAATPSTPSKKAKESAETPISGIAHVDQTKDQVALVDQHGKTTGQYLSANTNWKVFASKDINGKKYYRLGSQNQWVSADDVKYTNNTQAPTEETKLTDVGYVPTVSDHPTWKVALLDGNGHYTGKFISTNSNWKVFASKTINDQKYYRLGSEKQWVPAQYIQIGQKHTETPLSGTAHVSHVANHPTWKVALLDGNGHYTGKFISTNTNWKVFATKIINGQKMYRIGAQNQWIPAKYVTKFIAA